MAEVISLSKVRKAKARAADRAEAAENRVRFGRSKAEKSAAAAEEERHRRLVDGARRQAPGEPEGAAGPDERPGD